MNTSNGSDPPEWNPLETNPFQNKCTRRGKGRKKTKMAKIEDKSSRQVTFSKRHSGLFKKANELSTLTDAKIAITVFTPSGKALSFAHPNLEVVENKFRNENQNLEDLGDETRSYLVAQTAYNIDQNNRSIIQLEDMLRHEKNRAKQINRVREETLEQGRWSSTRVHNLNDKEISDLSTKIHNLGLSMDERLKNHQASPMNPDQYQDSNQISRGQITTGTGNSNYNQERSMFDGGLYQPSFFNNMNCNFPWSNGRNIVGPCETNIMDTPGSSRSNLMDPTYDPRWDQFSTFSFHGIPNSSNNVVINNNNVVPYVMQPANYMVPQDNMMIQDSINYCNIDGNFGALN